MVIDPRFRLRRADPVLRRVQAGEAPDVTDRGRLPYVDVGGQAGGDHRTNTSDALSPPAYGDLACQFVEIMLDSGFGFHEVRLNYLREFSGRLFGCDGRALLVSTSLSVFLELVIEVNEVSNFTPFDRVSEMTFRIALRVIGLSSGSVVAVILSVPLRFPGALPVCGSLPEIGALKRPGSLLQFGALRWHG